MIGASAPIAGSARSGIPSFIVMDVMRAALAAEIAGRSIMHMEVGQPGTPAPRAARDSGERARCDAETLGYTMALGNDALRARIARALCEWYGVRVAPGTHRCDGRIVGGVRARLPRHVRRRAMPWRCLRPAIPATGTS